MHMAFIYMFGLLSPKLNFFFPLKAKFAQEICEQLCVSQMFICVQWQFTENFAVVSYEALIIF